ARSRVDPRRAGVPPLSVRLLAVDAHRASATLRAERRVGVRRDRARRGGGLRARHAARGVHGDRPAGDRARQGARRPAGPPRSRTRCAERATSRAASRVAHPELPRRRATLVRLLRRNALGVYAVYAAAILSGLLVTPVVIHSIGKSAFGIWSFIGSV